MGKIVMRRLSKNIDKIIIVLSYILLIFILLSLTPGILYQEKLAQIGIWQETREIKSDSFIVRYHLNTSDNKPTVLTIDGDELLAIDGSESMIDVDNSPRRMWDHTFRNVISETSFNHSMAWEDYQLMQIVTINDNNVTFEYKFLSTENENVDLILSLKHRYDEYSTLTLDNLEINENQENELLIRYAVKIELDSTFSVEDNVSYEYDNGINWLRLSFYSTDIPSDDRWHPVAKLIMSYSWIEQ